LVARRFVFWATHSTKRGEGSNRLRRLGAPSPVTLTGAVGRGGVEGRSSANESSDAGAPHRCELSGSLRHTLLA
jgi:hypothetical protein